MNVFKILFISLSLIILIGCSSSQTHKKPNFLFVVVDDLGRNDLSVMGSNFYETPHIDRIAQQGMNFTKGYATSAVCSPSRASLLTGRYTATHGITDWIGAPTGSKWRNYKRYSKLLPPEYNHFLPHEYITLPEALKEDGYRTFFAGKWHLGSEEYNSLPTNHGFEINKGGYEAGGPYKGGYFSPFNNPYLTDHESERGMSLSMKLAKETSEFIKQNKNTPFLAYLSFYAVHAPLQTSQEKWLKYRSKADSMGIHEEGFEMERVFPIRKYQDNPVYAGLIEQVDDAVGYVLQTLSELGVEDNTVVIFTSDNGGVASGDDFATNNSPLRGGKGYQWEGGINIPYFIYVPWLNHNGEHNSTPVKGADFYPTILDLASVDLKQDIDGTSLVPLLKGNKMKSRPLYWHYPHYGNQGGEPNSIISENNWKLIHYWEDGRDELYDIETDVNESINLASKCPEKVKSMRGELMKWLNKSGAKFPSADPLFNQDSLQMKLNFFKTEKLKRIEEKRKRMLNKDWQPNADWWGSAYTND